MCTNMKYSKNVATCVKRKMLTLSRPESTVKSLESTNTGVLVIHLLSGECWVRTLQSYVIPYPYTNRVAPRYVDRAHR